jgi:methyl-accepting chemotaxis protein
MRVPSRGLGLVVRRRPIGLKLGAGFAVVLAGCGLIAWTALSAARAVNATTTRVATESGVAELAELHEIGVRIGEIRLLGLEYPLAASVRARRSVEEATAFKSVMNHLNEEITASLDEFARRAGSPRERILTESLSDEYAAYAAASEEQVVEPADAGRFVVARAAALGPVGREYDGVVGALQALRANVADDAEQLGGHAAALAAAGRARTAGAAMGTAVFGIAIAFVIARRMSRAMGKVASAAAGIASGDLTVRAEVTTRDEIETMAEAFNAMADRLHHMVTSERAVKTALEGAVSDYSRFAERVASGDLTARVATNGSAELKTLTSNLNAMVSGLGNLSGEVLKSAQGVGASASQILATVSAQSATVTQQSAAINETSVTVDELRASAEQAALKAQAVASQAQTSVQVSAEGTEAVDIIIARLESIRERVETIAQNILQLSEQTHQISELTATVDDISEQSNLLALNATIEAARAGEQGRGFAVVAAEVRNLAEQSKQGTAQVRTILTDIQKATNSAVMATEQGIKVVEESRALGHRAGESIATLAATIKETAQAAQQISATAQQQSLGIDQISESMKDIAEAATQFVSGVAESKSSARALDDLATELQGLTERYKVKAG